MHLYDRIAIYYYLLIVIACAIFTWASIIHEPTYKADLLHITDHEGVTLMILYKGRVVYMADK